MKKIRFYQVDSFTRELFKGNPAGVVPEADGLSEAQMQMIARELNNSETAFVFSANDAECDGEIRYFTPQTEVPICGHATIAAMYVKALEGQLPDSVYRIRTKAGVLPFEILKTADDYKIVMNQGRIEFQTPLGEGMVQRIFTALTLEQADRDERCPVQIVSLGHSKVMIGIKRREKLNALTPNMAELVQISRELNCNGYFVFTFDSPEPEVLTYGRMFAPAIGITEDPVTGNAHGPLGAYLVQHGLVEHSGSEFVFQGKQGEAIGRLGTVTVKVEIAGGMPVRVQIAGTAVIVFQAELALAD